MWNNSSGRTPKSCSSLFDLKEVVQRQQQPSSCGGSSNSYSGPQGGRALLPPDLQGRALVEDDGFFKEPFGECPWAVEECPGPAVPPVGGWGGARASSPVACQGAPVALDLLWGRGATYHSGTGVGVGAMCVEGIVGGHGAELGTRAFPPWPGDLGQGQV